MTRQATVSHVRPHTFGRDHQVPTDYHGRAWCRWCGLPGEPGDERHPEGARSLLPDTPAEARALDARRLGERLDERER